jgi:antitoxin HigA-1
MIRIPKNRPSTHPGEMLRDEFLIPMGLTHAQLAEEIKVPLQRIEDVTDGREGLTPSLALRLAKFFGMSSVFWMNLQVIVDLQVAEQKEASVLKTIKPAKMVRSTASHENPANGHLLEPVTLFQTKLEEGVYSGFRNYSPKQLGEMIEYFLCKLPNLYKTKLTKLLFYSDFTSYQLRGTGISGATYFNRPFGPVPEGMDDVLKELVAKGEIKTDAKTRTINLGETFDPSSISLTKEERKVLGWIVDNYGELSASEISEMTHLEKAYRDTSPNDPISYAYSGSFNILPRNLGKDRE